MWNDSYLPFTSPKLPAMRTGAIALQWVRSLGAMVLIFLPASHSVAADSPDLTQKSLEDLMNIQVTSVSRKEQKTSQAAAAIFVISQEDISRSGALNIPDLLRMVPGVDVAQIDASNWAISVRGFNGQFSNKLLVLVDGRTVYSPMFAGVFWNAQNVPLDSIERIEIIRGPGAAIWGSNAVDGVINIITRSAEHTQGGWVSGSAGNAATGPAAISYSGKVPGFGAYRVYAEGFRYNSLPTFANAEGHDDWRLAHGGFRTDSTLSAKDSLTTEGEILAGDAGELTLAPVSLAPPVTTTVALRERYASWNALARWNRNFSAQSGTSFQVYFDRTCLDDKTFNFQIDNFDLDFQYHVAWGARQDIVWGLGYRLSADDTTPTLRAVITPNNRTTELFRSFAQDEITILPNRLQLSLGARFEHNSYNGLDFQPSGNLAWNLNSRNMIWAAISSADRTPSRTDTGFRLNLQALPGPGGLPILVSLLGDPNFRNEHLTAFQAGYRNTWTSRISLDSTIFYNRYRDLESVEIGATAVETNPAPIHLLVPETISNGLRGETHGGELFANWKVSYYWTLSPGYSYLATHLHPFAGSQDFTDAAGTEGGVPDHQAQLRSSVSLPHNLQWNASAYFVNRLPAAAIPSYTRLDTGLIWHGGERVSATVVGQNLLKNLHPEFAGPNSVVLPGMMRRAAYAKVVWSF
jgi:iron complex outermembrane receptor protein